MRNRLNRVGALALSLVFFIGSSVAFARNEIIQSFKEELAVIDVSNETPVRGDRKFTMLKLSKPLRMVYMEELILADIGSAERERKLKIFDNYLLKMASAAPQFISDFQKAHPFHAYNHETGVMDLLATTYARSIQEMDPELTLRVYILALAFATNNSGDEYAFSWAKILPLPFLKKYDRKAAAVQLMSEFDLVAKAKKMTVEPAKICSTTLIEMLTE